MKTIVPTLIAVLILLPVAARAVHAKIRRFRRVVNLEGREMNEAMITPGPSPANLTLCVERCVSHPGCDCLKHHGGNCTLYGQCKIPDGTIDGTQFGPLPGAVYYVAERCPEIQGYTLVTPGRLCVKVSQDNMTWGDSRNHCETEGGRLLAVSNLHMCTEVINWAKTAGASNAWIGNWKEKGAIRTIDATGITVEGQGCSLQNHVSAGMVGGCVKIRSGEGLELIDCSVPLQFICEILITTPPPE